MTQEELKQLKELLSKARAALPKATTFQVEGDSELILVGESSYTNNGSWDEYRLLPSGEITHKDGIIY